MVSVLSRRAEGVKDGQGSNADMVDGVSVLSRRAEGVKDWCRLTRRRYRCVSVLSRRAEGVKEVGSEQPKVGKNLFQCSPGEPRG